MNVKKTSELIEAIVSTISKVLVIKTVTDNNDGTYTLDTIDENDICSTKWATLNRVVTIDSEDYKIVDLLPNKWIKVSGAVLPVAGTSFNLYNFFYTHGTILEQNKQLTNIVKSTDKTPMIFLHESIRERFNNDFESTIDRDSECDFYFMANCEPRNWVTDDHDRYAVKPIRNLLSLFINALENASNVDQIEGFDVTDHANWGVYVSDKGHVKNIFPDNLSGSHLKITISFFKSSDCCSCCN
jgi:hypothetical protein